MSNFVLMRIAFCRGVPQGTPGPFTGPQGWATAAKTSLLK